MNADGVDIFNEANCDLVILSIADNLEFELLPAEDALFNEDLSDE